MTLVALNEAVSYFDSFGLRQTPRAARSLPEMADKLAAVNAVCAEVENPFVRFGWSRHTFRIPAASLNRQSRLRIENAEDTSRYGGPPFFMLNYAVVRKGK